VLLIIGYALLLPFWVISVQLCFYALNLKAEQKQQNCQAIGIIFTTLGVVSLVSHDIAFTTSGLVLIMLGLRMMAIGLDRIDKSTFIDRYKND